jgi:hypothetical protein
MGRSSANENPSDLNDLTDRGTPFRASEAHRLPKSAGYVSAGQGEVKPPTASTIEVFPA